MATSNERKCSNCIKWDYTSGNFGFCRAKAPMPIPVNGTASDQFQLVWPSTGMDDWCAEFENASDNRDGNIQ